MNRSFHTLPVPEITDSNLNHSFKFNQPGDHRKVKKPPKLHPKESSFSRHFDHEVHAISFKENSNNSFQSASWSSNSSLNSSCYDSSKRSSYYEQCFDQISKIGEGSFGEVFKVKSHEDGKMYAVKKTKQMYRSENHRRESLEEVRRYEEFSNNQHCIRLYKAWEQDDLLYIQIELCKGSVESYIAEVKRAPEEFVWSFLLDMLKALKSLHERNLVHLDVKLDNILITEDRICKLADFGLVFDLQNSPKSKAVEGDSRYLAPELLRGEYSLANDVFSLGITLLELATNLELPSNGKLWHELRTGHLPETATNLLSKDLQIIIREMMEEDPKKRPTVEKLLQKPILRKLNFKRQIKTIGNNSITKITSSFKFIAHFLITILMIFINFFKLEKRSKKEVPTLVITNTRRNDCDEISDDGCDLDSSTRSSRPWANISHSDDDNNNESNVTPTLNNSIPRLDPELKFVNSTPLNHYNHQDELFNRKLRRNLTKSGFESSPSFMVNSNDNSSHNRDSSSIISCKKLMFQDDDFDDLWMTSKNN